MFAVSKSLSYWAFIRNCDAKPKSNHTTESRCETVWCLVLTKMLLVKE